MRKLLQSSTILSPARRRDDMCLALIGSAMYGHLESFVILHRHIGIWRTAHPYSLSLLYASFAGHLSIVNALIEADKSQTNPNLKLSKAIVPRFCLERRRYGVSPCFTSLPPLSNSFDSC